MKEKHWPLGMSKNPRTGHIVTEPICDSMNRLSPRKIMQIFVASAVAPALKGQSGYLAMIGDAIVPKLNRKQFLQGLVSGCLVGGKTLAAQRQEKINDLVIYGGSSAGVMA